MLHFLQLTIIFYPMFISIGFLLMFFYKLFMCSKEKNYEKKMKSLCFKFLMLFAIWIIFTCSFLVCSINFNLEWHEGPVFAESSKTTNAQKISRNNF